MGHTVVGLCMYLSVYFSLLALKRATQAKVDICLKMNCKDFGNRALFVRLWFLAWLSMAIWSFSKAKLSTVDYLEADRSEFHYRIASRVDTEKLCKQAMEAISLVFSMRVLY